MVLKHIVDMCLCFTVGLGNCLKNNQAGSYQVQGESLLANSLSPILGLGLSLLLRESFVTTVY